MVSGLLRGLVLCLVLTNLYRDEILNVSMDERVNQGYDVITVGGGAVVYRDDTANRK